MAKKRRGSRSVYFQNPPLVRAAATIVGDVEGEGPLGKHFDMVLKDDTWGEKSFEKAESKMFEQCVRIALQKLNWDINRLDCLLGGDLLNQIVSSNYAARELAVPFLGLYGACSTMAESLLIGAMLIDGGYAKNTACVAVSHFSTAERQFRFPLEMGTSSPPTSQRTVTGAGAVILHEAVKVEEIRGAYSNIVITGGTIGKVIDMGITDASNMGAAMAPAAADTIITHLKDMDRTTTDYDVIVTGDLGRFGSEMLHTLLAEQFVDIGSRHIDCGNIIFHPEQNVNCGGSGCGCSASVLGARLLPAIHNGEWSRMLFLATGALMSAESTKQGESIPAIAHAVVIERRGKRDYAD